MQLHYVKYGQIWFYRTIDTQKPLIEQVRLAEPNIKMKPGRNEPCPCGSGKKFKKCCVDSPPRQTAPQTSSIEISRLTAYKGHVGRERQKWCRDFVKWKTEQINRTVRCQQHLAKDSEKCIACSKGCCHCCSQHIGAYLQEAEAIVYWLYNHDTVRKEFLTRYSVWRADVRKNENVFEDVKQAGTVSMSQPLNIDAHRALLKKALVYERLNIPCPFLDNGTCSIYPVRPFVCAGVVVVSPPENCKPSNDADPVILTGVPLPDHPLPYFRGPEDAAILSPAALLVYEILNGGFMYLNDIPGLNGLEREAFGDPEVRAVMGI